MRDRLQNFRYFMRGLHVNSFQSFRIVDRFENQIAFGARYGAPEQKSHSSIRTQDFCDILLSISEKVTQRLSNVSYDVNSKRTEKFRLWRVERRAKL